VSSSSASALTVLCDGYRVLKAEEALRDDEEIAKLQQECNWFQSEATRLQGNKNNMDRDIMVKNLIFFLSLEFCYLPLFLP
jgi:hypothetical protein